jgi:hypothetical protein
VKSLATALFASLLLAAPAAAEETPPNPLTMPPQPEQVVTVEPGVSTFPDVPPTPFDTPPQPDDGAVPVVTPPQPSATARKSCKRKKHRRVARRRCLN